MTVDSEEENNFVFEFGNQNDIHVWIGVFEYVSDQLQSRKIVHSIIFFF